MHYTANCNLHCPYCYEGHGIQQLKGRKLEGSLQPDVSKKIISFIKDWTIENKAGEVIITLFGGEPLLNYKEGSRILREIFKWSRERKIKFKSGMFTNGTLFNEKIIRDLKKYNFNKPLITFDGSRHYHDRKKNFGNKELGTYDGLIDNLKLLIINQPGLISHLIDQCSEIIESYFDWINKRVGFLNSSVL
jgi:uncharacterized protein